jgi:ketosteroid isomerase-like protein
MKFLTGCSRFKVSLHAEIATLLFLLFIGLAVPGSVKAAEPSDDGTAAKVLSLEQLWNQAEVAQDIHSLDQILADTFIYVDVDGSLQNKTEFINGVTRRAEHIDSIRSESMLSHVHGNTVIITGVYHEKGTLNGKPYYHYGRFTDTWIKEGSAWLCAASQSTLIPK